ncbi:MAG: hypothetical protein JSS49_00735 [Planctomycetes bacterium]|nr:hypothetical protein [Planctomycetota bacterium]
MNSMWKKVIGPTAVVSLLWFFVNNSTALLIDDLDQVQTEVLNENRTITRLAGRMEAMLWRLQSLIMDAERRGDRIPPMILQEHIAEFESITTEVKASPTQKVRAVADKIDREFDNYITAVRGVLDSGSDTSPREVSLTDLAKMVVVPCQELSELGQQLVYDSFEQRRKQRRIVDRVRLAFVVAGLVVGLLLGLRVARSLRRSISEITVTLKDASGALENLASVEVCPSHASEELPTLEQLVQVVSMRIRQTVDDLRQARQDVIRAERLAAVGELAASVAHELRNPLQAVKLLVQCAVQAGSVPVLKGEDLFVVSSEIGRMEAAIQELLDFARPPMLHRRPHDLRETLQRAVNLAQGRAAHVQVTIDTKMPDRPVMIHGDPQQLDLVFLNVILNGIDSQQANGTIHVSIEFPDSTTDCEVKIRDHGMGIAEPILERMFEPFTTTKPRGVGLGLAICSRIIREHEGKITARNCPDGGAIITVLLPLLSATATLESHRVN